MLGAMPAVRKEVTDLDARGLTTGGRVGLVLDARGIADERPSVTVWGASVKLSPLRHWVPPGNSFLWRTRCPGFEFRSRNHLTLLA